MRVRGRLCRLTVFIQHENVVRLLEFLGYRQEEKLGQVQDSLVALVHRVVQKERFL